MKNKASFLSSKKLYPLWMLLCGAAFIYAQYAFWYTYLDWDNLVNVGLSDALATGGFAGIFTLAVAAGREKVSAKTAALSFFGAAIGYNVCLWTILAVVNRDGLFNRRAIIIAYAVLNTVFAALCVAMYAVSAKKRMKALNSVLAAVCAVAFVCIAVLPVRTELKNFGITARSTDKIGFEPISAGDVRISDDEKKLCREWYETNILGAANGLEPAFDFSVGGQSVRALLREGRAEATVWESEPGRNTRGGSASILTVKAAEYSIRADVEAVLYEDEATCEWTVKLTNTSDADSEEISDFFAADFTADRGADKLYYCLGSDTSADDFMLKEMKLGSRAVFTSSEGRSSDLYLPYFNFSGNGGFVLGVGWTGLWKVTAGADVAGARVSVRQASLRGCLSPGETIRSPLVSMSFYNGDNPVKGFNTFRAFVTDCSSPGNARALTMLETAGPDSRRTADEILADLDTFDDRVFDGADYFWMDAGWYANKDGWGDSLGNWTPDPARFDNGISELAAYGARRGLGQVLWYEPERVHENTVFYNKGAENEGWLISDGSDTYCWNLSNPDALKWYTDYLMNSMKENGVTCYRQDQNMALDGYWERGDDEFFGGRTGFCENHYVQGEYAFLDSLLDGIPGLLIDNCASGGRRLDLEMTRRSIPVWRSDYNCAWHADVLESTQSQTLGLSCFLPISGTVKYCGSEYEAITSLLPCFIETFGTVSSPYYDSFRELRENMTGRFFPLACGGLRDDSVLAHEWTDDKGESGFAAVYKRSGFAADSYTVALSGLAEDAEYRVWDYDSPDAAVTATGAELMSEGFAVSLPGSPDAAVVVFEIIPRRA